MPDEQLNNNQLEWSYWFVQNRLKLKNYLISFLVGIIVLSFLYTAWGLIKLYIIDYSSYRKMTLEAPLDYVNYAGVKNANSPVDPAVLDSVAIAQLDGKYDLATKLSNPNARWFVSFDYAFQAPGLTTMPKRGFLLPGEQKYFVNLGAQSQRAFNKATLTINNISWKRLSNFEAFKSERFNFKVTDLNFVSAGQSLLSLKAPISKTTFRLTNQSVYNFWRVPLIVVLYSGNRLAGINYVVLDNVTSGQTLPVEVNWFQSLGPISRSEVMPDLNILDSSVYMPYPAGDSGQQQPSAK